MKFLATVLSLFQKKHQPKRECVHLERQYTHRGYHCKSCGTRMTNNFQFLKP